MNKAIIMGRLTRDPELRTLQNDLAVCTVTVAVDRKKKREDGSREADFIPVVFWRQQAEFVSRYFEKGSRIALVGHLQVRNYEDTEGKKRTATEVVAEDVYFADSKTKQDGGGQREYKPQFGQPQEYRPPQDTSGYVPDDDISLPFDLDQ